MQSKAHHWLPQGSVEETDYTNDKNIFQNDGNIQALEIHSIMLMMVGA